MDTIPIHLAAAGALMKRYRDPDYEAKGGVRAKRGAPGQGHVGTIDSAIQMANFRKDWLNARIMGKDQKCPPYLKAPDVA